MIFKFLKYINPISYFNLQKNDGTTVFPKWKKLPEDVKHKIEYDNRYQSEYSSQLDASWQAIQKGYIGDSETIKFDNKKIPIRDEYHFIRKYYSKIWVYYTLLMRIITLHNPIAEVSAFIKSKKIKKINVYKKPILYPDWERFKSKLIASQPKVSVVIPTLNRYKYLKDVLKDLEKQDYKNFEVIIVDQSEPFNKKFYKNYNLNLQVVYQKEKALWLARNTAIKMAKGSFIALSEDDIKIQYNWISNHLKAMDFFKAQITTGPFFPEGNTLTLSSSFFSISSQFATGNAMLYKDVFKQIGVFDRQFEKQRMGDGEFGMRVYLNNIKSISNPYSVCVDIKAPTGGLRQMGSWDGIRPTNWFAPRPIPSVLYFFRKYYPKKNVIFYLIKTIPPSLIPYRYKRNNKIMALGFLITLLLLPLVVFQVVKSWNLASKKLKQGDLIEKIS
jgi:glycosyltransferase involved in cell wall biosynthesis